MRALGKVFGRGEAAFRALDDVSLDIRAGEFFTLLGPSGCGKTTLLRLLAGFERPTSGTIMLEGRDIGALPPFRRPVNTVFQNYALFPHMSVAQNVAFGLEMLGRPAGAVAETVARMLALVRMEPLAERRITELSGGQQQRVALARALAPQPKLLLLDEPLSALDLQLRKEMQLELKRMQRETGITFVFVTHDQDEALAMSDRIAVIDGGRVLQVGPPREIYDHPRHRFVASFIGEINLVPARRAGDGAFGIAGGGHLDARDDAAGSPREVTLAIRPERVKIVEAGSGGLAGTLDDVVYHGTDTLLHFHLADGTPMRARRQNASARMPSFKPGDRIGWRVDPESVAVLPAGERA